MDIKLQVGPGVKRFPNEVERSIRPMPPKDQDKET
jgi:hypothetical protein